MTSGITSQKHRVADLWLCHKSAVLCCCQHQSVHCPMQWVSTSDFCHRSAVFSYALNSTATDQSRWVSDFNHFVLFDTQSLIACHDFEYIDLMPVGTTHSARCHTASTSLLSSAPALLMTAVKPALRLSADILDEFDPFMPPGSPRHQLCCQVQKGDWQQGRLRKCRHGQLCAARRRLDAHSCHLDCSKGWIDNHLSEWCDCNWAIAVLCCQMSWLSL